MHILSDAAGKVADGDFSVRIEPLHAPAHQNEVDAMFRDFNKMTAELGSLNMMKKDFISNVSHEFKTPLSVIVNYAQYLQDETLDDAARQEYLNTIISSAGRLNALVTDILRLNKVENQAIALNRRSYDLCRQLCDCAISFEDKWDEKDIDFGVEVEEHCEVFADAELLSVVWNNLISNALKFTESGGTVTLRQHSDEMSITVQVTDSGCGMDESTLRRIFDKFYQGDTSHSKEGNGLGLSLVKRIVELSDGTIRVESAVGHGTTFTVVLPRQGKGTSNGEVV